MFLSTSWNLKIWAHSDKYNTFYFFKERTPWKTKILYRFNIEFPKLGLRWSCPFALCMTWKSDFKWSLINCFQSKHAQTHNHPNKFLSIQINITIFTFSIKGNFEKLKICQHSILVSLNWVQGDLALLLYAWH